MDEKYANVETTKTIREWRRKKKSPNAFHWVNKRAKLLFNGHVNKKKTSSEERKEGKFN